MVRRANPPGAKSFIRSNMKNLTRIAAVLLAIQSTPAFSQPYVQKACVIRDVTVITMTSKGVRPNQNVVIENGVITRIEDARKGNAPAGAKIIDGRGKYLMPGLFDMHAHFFYEQGEHVNTCEEEIKVMLANGVTTARILCGDEVYLEARQNVAEKKWIGPNLVVASPQFMGMKLGNGPQYAAICTTPEEAERAVRKFKQEGYDAIKITFRVKPDVFQAICKTAAEVGLPVTGHVGPLVKLPAALKARLQIEHLDEYRYAVAGHFLQPRSKCIGHEHLEKECVGNGALSR